MKLFTSILKSIIASILIVGAVQVNAQDLNIGADAATMASQIVGEGVTISNLTIDCDPSGYATFANAGGTSVNLDNGILLTTGAADDAFGANSSENTSVNIGNPYNGDADLQDLVSFTLQDACSFSFDFEAQSDMITVQYVFGSEEYNEYVCSSFNDIFAFFVNGPIPGGGTYANQNVALIPGSGGLPVSINALNNGSSGTFGNNANCTSLNFSSLFVDNAGGATIEYDGFTVILTAEVAIIPGETYTFKFAIADASDSSLDSGVFIKANSFSVFNCQAGNLSAAGVAGSAVEFCSTDAVDDLISVSTNSTATGDTYEFILTDNSNQILAINSSGNFDLTGFANGNYNVYGISHDGVLNGLSVGNNISGLSSPQGLGCFELSDPIEITMASCLQGNPDLEPEDCTLFDVILILDESGSIDGDEQAVRDAAVLLAEGISGTGASMAVIEFSTGATISNIPGFGAGYNEVTSAYVDALEDYLADEYNANGWTNWEDALDKAVTLNAIQVADLVLIVTDGNPTAYVGNGSCSSCNDSSGSNCYDCTEAISLNHAIPKANLLKAAGSHMFGLAIGDNIDLSNISAITGPDQDLAPGDQPGPDPAFNQADYTSIPFSELAHCLEMIADISCIPPCDLEIECPNAYGGFFACVADIPAADINSIEIIDSCNPAIITFTTEETGTGCGIDTLYRTYNYQIVDGGNVQYCSVLYKATDDVAPVFQNEPQPIVVSCGEVIPAPIDCLADDNCSDVVYAYSESITGSHPLLECPTGDASNHTVWIGSTGSVFPGVDGPNFNAAADNEFVENNDGSAMISGEVIINGNSNKRFRYAVWFKNKRTYAEWSAIPNGSSPTGFRQAKLETSNGVNITNEYLDWSYYEFDETKPNKIIGMGDFAGLEYDMTQMPADYRYGVQVGDKASLQSNGFGLSSWMFIAGVNHNGANVSVQGDFNLSISQCETPEVEITCQSNYTITRTWTATDACGNQSSVSQEIQVGGDDIDPVITCPEEATVLCNTSTSPDVTGMATATDNCDDDLTITHTDGEIQGDCPYYFERTWAVVDDCENRATCVQIINIVDNEDPFVITGVPAEVNVQCEADVPPMVAPTFGDNCDDELDILPASSIVQLECGFDIHRSWTATDNCGNDITVVQNIFVRDTEDPIVVVGVPAEINVQCEADVPPMVAPTFDDNCDDNLDILPASSIVQLECGFDIERSWTATDDCDNSITVNQIVRVRDTEDPFVIVGVPEEVNVQCEADVPPMVAPTFGDNCDDDLEIFPASSIVQLECGFDIHRSWTATDDCGNDITVVQNIFVRDTEDPFVIDGVPAEVNVECGNDIPTAEPTFGDNCDDDLDVLPASSIVQLECGYDIERSWTATDDCDNSITVNQVIRVRDTQDPFVLVGIPAEVTIECGDPLPTDAPTFDDVCDEDLTVVPGSSTSGDECHQVITRTWTATDDCNNSITVEQVIHILDTLDPVFSGLPENETYTCEETVPEPAIVTADDLCQGPIQVAFSDSVDDSGCPVYIYRTWTADDGCGNVASYTQTITIIDNIAPEFVDFPFHIYVSCELVDELTLEATDNCTEVVVTHTDVQQSGGCYGNLIRTWIATDECGNVTTAEQIIGITDFVPPTIVGVGEDMYIECDQDYVLPEVSAFDNCGEASLSFDEEVIPGDCPNNYTVVWTWTAIDYCDNVTVEEKRIFVSDNTDPTFTYVPASVDLDCTDAIPAAEDGTATDNCGTATVSMVETTELGSCPQSYTIVRTYTATDLCNNTAVAVQNIVISDTTPPVISGIDEELTYLCTESIPDPVGQTAIDACGEATIGFVDQQLPSECASEYDILRTFTATDECQNSSQFVQTIHVIDEVAPVLSAEPEDLVLDCEDEIPVPEVLTAEDNCDELVVVQYSQEYEGDQPTPGSVADCALFTPAEPVCDGFNSWAMRLFNLDGYGDFVATDAFWVEFPDNTAHLTAHVSSISNPAAGFDVDVYFENGMDWDSWSNQAFATNFKDDCDEAGINYLDWTYYIMNSDGATLTGTGYLAGSLINLAHAPSSYYYGFQVGVHANNLNANNGIGGWFSANGELVEDGESQGDVTFTGDFAFDIDCCPRYEVIRTWTATDCAGNTTSWSQNISFANLNDNNNGDPTLVSTCREDLNGDGQVNTADMIALLANFGCVENCIVDFDGNGATNTSELLLMLVKMGTSCE